MQQQKFLFILLGDTRTGKSSFTNQHAGKILAQVGLPNGHSTTKRISIYENGSVTYVDTMGFNDTDNTFTNKEIREHIVDKICAMGNDDAKIIFVIFESFESDTLRLQDTLKNLEKLFGVTAVESTILVLTKHNLFADQYQREYEEETKVVSSSVEVTKAKEYQEEFKVNVEKIDARVKEIEKPVEQIQTFNDKYYESKNVDRTLTFNYQVKETVSRGGLAGMVGFTKTITKNVSHSVKIPETVFEEKVKQTQEKITKVDKDVSVDYVKSFDALTEKRLRFEEILEKESREFELNNADLKALYGNDPQKVKRYFEGKARKVIMKDFQLVNVN